MEQYRQFMHDDLERYLPILKDLMCRSNLTKAHYGYSPTVEAIMGVVTWTRAFDAGDFEKASFDAYLDAADLASQLWNDWYCLNNPLHKVAVIDDLGGLTIEEFAAYVMDEWDRIQRELIAGAAEKRGAA
jgi:hypothetical protein